MISLNEIADAIDEQQDHEHDGFYDRETQEIAFLDSTSGVDYKSEKIEDLPDWQQEEATVYRLIQEDIKTSRGNEDYHCRFLKLPTKFEVNEYQLMEFFSIGQADNTSAELLNAIRGKGAFRYFRDTIERLGLTQKWYDYKNQCLLDFAREFCEANKIEFNE